MLCLPVRVALQYYTISNVLAKEVLRAVWSFISYLKSEWELGFLYNPDDRIGSWRLVKIVLDHLRQRTPTVIDTRQIETVWNFCSHVETVM